MNPFESAATEKLSDVFLDRFDVVEMTYPAMVKTEHDIIISKGKKIVEFNEKLLSLVIAFIRELRENKDLVKKP